MTPELAYELAAKAVSENSSILEKFRDGDGMRWLERGEYVLALIDPDDEVGKAAITLFGLAEDFADAAQTLPTDLLEVARHAPKARARDVALKLLAHGAFGESACSPNRSWVSIRCPTPTVASSPSKLQFVHRNDHGAADDPLSTIV